MKLLKALLTGIVVTATIGAQAATFSGAATLDWSLLMIDFAPGSGTLNGDASKTSASMSAIPAFSSFPPDQDTVDDVVENFNWTDLTTVSVVATDTITNSTATAEASAKDSSISASAIFSTAQPLSVSFAGNNSRVTRTGTFVAVADGELNISIPYLLTAATDTIGITAGATVGIQAQINGGFSRDNFDIEELGVGLPSQASGSRSGVLSLTIPFTSGDSIALGFGAEAGTFIQSADVVVPLPAPFVILGTVLPVLGFLARRQM